MTFTDNVLVLKSTTKEVEFPIDEKATFTFTNIDDGSGLKLQKSGNIVFSIGQGLDITGLASGEVVYVYDLSGQAVARAKASANGQVSINFGNRQGTYIVKTSNKSLKINF